MYLFGIVNMGVFITRLTSSFPLLAVTDGQYKLLSLTNYL